MAPTTESFGRYQVLDEIGRGGMSVVHRGYDQTLKRPVAIKIMHDMLTSQSEARTRFRREAIAVANITHPHIVKVHDFADNDETPVYMVMELVEGPSLATFLETHHIEPPEVALLLIRPMVDALCAAHAAGIIHRDIKPENILISFDGRIKLTDFGIARILEEQTLTLTGTLLGSPAYMAPECLEGEEPTPATDIFSIGTLLYRLTVGTLPFQAPSPHALLKKIATVNCVRAGQANPKIHPALDRMIHRCLTRRPEDRYPSASDLLRDMDSFLEEIAVSPNEERIRFVEQPQSYGVQLSKRLVDRLYQQGQIKLVAGQTDDAIEHFDRVLSLVPEHSGVQEALASLQRRAFRKRLVRATGLAAMIATLVLVAILSAGILSKKSPSETPDPNSITPNSPKEAPKTSLSQEQTVEIRGGLKGQLFVNGQAYKPSVDLPPGVPVKLRLPPGKHRIKWKDKEGTIEKEIELRANVPPPPVVLELPISQDADTTQKPITAPKEVTVLRTVKFNAKRWVNVFLNGATTPKVREQQGVFELQLQPGTHQLKFTNDYAKPKTITLEVSKNSPPGVIAVDLVPKDGLLKLKGLPPGLAVTVEIAEQKRLVSEFNVDDPILVSLITSRTHTVRVVARGYRPLERTVTFTPGRLFTLDVNLLRL